MTGAPATPANDAPTTTPSDSFVAATPKLDSLVGNEIPRSELKQVVTLAAQGKPFPRQSYIIKGALGNDQDVTAEALASDLKAWGVQTFKVTGDKLALQTGAAGVEELFKNAWAAADASPNHTAAIYIKDLDRAFPIRQQSSSPEPSHANRLLGAFLDEAGDLNKDNGSRLILMGTTSKVDSIDEAAYQKFERTLESKEPENAGQRLQVLNNIIHDKGYNVAPDADVNELAGNTAGSNPTRLSSIMKTSAVLAGDNPISTANLREASLQESYGAPLKNTNPDWMFRLTGLHEMGHVVVREFFDQLSKEHPDQKPRGIGLISLVPREGTTAAVQLKYSGNPAKTFEYYVAEISSNLGGRAAESIFGDGHMSAGPGSDIRYATESASEAVQQMGMGKTVGVLQPGMTGISPAYNDAVKTDEENLMKASDQLAVNIITFYRPFMESMADDMLQHRNEPDKLIFSGDEFRKKLMDWQGADEDRLRQFVDLANQARRTMADLKPAVPQPTPPRT